MRRGTLAAALAFVGCQACAQPAPPVSPPLPEAGDGSPCATIQAVDQARLIRLPDGGTFGEPCP